MARDFYPTGQLTYGGSTQTQADNVSIDVGNSGKLEATLANPNGTPVVGMRSVTFTWDMKVDNNGPELLVVTAVQNAVTGDIGWKFPGGISLSANVLHTSAKLSQKLGDAWIVNCSATGSLTDATGI